MKSQDNGTILDLPGMDVKKSHLIEHIARLECEVFLLESRLSYIEEKIKKSGDKSSSNESPE